MGLLDLTAAFDCVDHSPLLKLNFVLVDTVLDWLTSFITGRTQQVAYEGQLLPITSVVFGVPQGPFSVPCCSSYTLPSLAKWWRLTDSLCISRRGPMLTTARSTSPRQPSCCLDDVAPWMGATKSREDRSLMAGIQVPSGQDRHSVCASSVNLCQSGQHGSRPWCYHWQVADHVWPCRRSLPRCLLSATPDHPFTDRLDYCNSLFCGISDSLFRRLQSVQNRIRIE